MEDQLMNFISITNCQDPAKGQQFLEMSGGNLEVRIISKQSHYFLKLEKTDSEDRLMVMDILYFTLLILLH